MVIYYVALPFTCVEGGLAPGEAVECPHEAAAIRRAYAMSRNETKAAAVAFARRGSADLGEFEDAVILKTFGDVPEDFVGVRLGKMDARTCIRMVLSPYRRFQCVFA
jgi:hypothetical protein